MGCIVDVGGLTILMMVMVGDAEGADGLAVRVGGRVGTIVGGGMRVGDGTGAVRVGDGEDV